MENKKKRLGIVVVMLVLVLAIGATAGTTLAKYITSATMTTKSATVAKWGYTISVKASELFSEQYGDVASDYAKVVADDSDSIVAQADSTGHNIVAPGTKSSMTITINGTAEVNAILTIDLSEFQSIVLMSGGSPLYYPIMWTVNGTPVKDAKAASTKGISAAEFNAAVLAGLQADGSALNGLTSDSDGSKLYIEIPANTTLSETLVIGWEWAFESGNDTKDTILGHIASGSETIANAYAGSIIDIKLGMKISIVQTLDDFVD